MLTVFQKCIKVICKTKSLLILPFKIGVCVDVWAKLTIGKTKKVKRKINPGRSRR